MTQRWDDHVKLCAFAEGVLRAAGPDGLPEVLLWRALLSYGVTLDQYKRVRSALMLTGRIRELGSRLAWTGGGDS